MSGADDKALDGEDGGAVPGRPAAPPDERAKRREEWRRHKAAQRARDRELLEADLVRLPDLVFPYRGLGNYLVRLQYIAKPQKDDPKALARALQDMVVHLIADAKNGDMST
jgi:hypothetical protein